MLLASGKTHFIHDRAGNVIAKTDGTGSAGMVREYIWLPETEIAPTAGSRTVVDRPIAAIDAVSTAPVMWQVHVDKKPHVPLNSISRSSASHAE